MAYSLTWLPEVLRNAGLRVVEQPGWQTRGHGDVGPIKFILCHHTAAKIGTPTKNTVDLIANGRPDLKGPLSQLFLSKDGTFHVIAAGLGYHAGKGVWQGVTTGNSNSIGIEADNNGIGEPWPEVQVDAYARGCAAILKHIKAGAIMCAGHKEYALPKGRKIDPNFDMTAFRQRVSAAMEKEPVDMGDSVVGDVAFTIRHKPDGKWRLFKGDVSMADFETAALAEEGMRRIITPVVRQYTAKGEQIP